MPGRLLSHALSVGRFQVFDDIEQDLGVDLFVFRGVEIILAQEGDVIAPVMLQGRVLFTKFRKISSIQ